MTIEVEISDRLYDYTDEEKASVAVAEFMAIHGLDENAVVAIWDNLVDPRRPQLERLIFNAIEQNGPAKRAQHNVPAAVSLSIA